jgi:hypothetical protein
MSERVFRNQETRSIARMFGGGSLVMGLIVGLGSQGPWRVMWIVVGGALATVFELRWARQGIYVKPAGLLVRGGFRSRFLPWNEIENVGLQTSWWGLCAAIDTAEGQTVPARPLNAGRGVIPAMTRRAEAQVAELNALIARNRGSR